MTEASIIRGDVGFSNQGIRYGSCVFFGILFINVQKLLMHDSPGFPYFRIGSRFDVVVNSLDIVVFPVASNPMTG